MNQLYFHGVKFDLCRICLLEPETNRTVKFDNIFQDNVESSLLSNQITDILGINVENDNIKPNIICEYCQNSISIFAEMKKKAAESTVIINYLARTRFARPTTSNPCSSSSIGVKIEENDTELLPVRRTITTNVLERQKSNVQKTPHPSTYKLFTCIKSSCDLIFQTFDSFKFHHRKHFKYGTRLMCWQCCVPFPNFQELRIHQSRTKCRTPGMFKCFQCSERFDDLESFSVHKLKFHDGHLVPRKINNKSITCAFCQNKILISSYKNHLKSCN